MKDLRKEFEEATRADLEFSKWFAIGSVVFSLLVLAGMTITFLKSNIK
jgi:hypothetical protein